MKNASRIASLSDLAASDEEFKQTQDKKHQEHRSQFPKRLLWALKQLKEMKEVNGISQFTHSLQTATRAMKANASDEMIFAALMHDAGKALITRNHAGVIAETLSSVVSLDTYYILLTHETFQGFFTYSKLGLDPNARSIYKNEPWYESAILFNEWDELSLDPKYKSKPLKEFVPLVFQFAGKDIPRMMFTNAEQERMRIKKKAA